MHVEPRASRLSPCHGEAWLAELQGPGGATGCSRAAKSAPEDLSLAPGGTAALQAERHDAFENDISRTGSTRRRCPLDPAPISPRCEPRKTRPDADWRGSKHAGSELSADVPESDEAPAQQTLHYC